MGVIGKEKRPEGSCQAFQLPEFILRDGVYYPIISPGIPTDWEIASGIAVAIPPETSGAATSYLINETLIGA